MYQTTAAVVKVLTNAFSCFIMGYMNNDFNHIADWLRPLLDSQGMSVEELAQRAGITRTAIYNYIGDHNRPTEQSMAKICHVLGVPLEEGLRQYTPKKNGRPAGIPTDAAGVRSWR